MIQQVLSVISVILVTDMLLASGAPLAGQHSKDVAAVRQLKEYVDLYFHDPKDKMDPCLHWLRAYEMKRYEVKFLGMCYFHLKNALDTNEKLTDRSFCKKLCNSDPVVGSLLYARTDACGIFPLVVPDNQGLDIYYGTNDDTVLSRRGLRSNR
ncbi:hypothetical protein HDE_06088 [Halotydeus destructor]|nr:hypothetical protein HDE_06088 [Halotydeus destructor]